MYPQQPQPEQPQTPPPAPNGYPPQYPGAQLQQNYSPMPQNNPYGQPAPQQAPANWYTPTPAPNSDRPASADQYLQQAGGQPQNSPQQLTNPATGQRINGQYAVDYLGGIAPQAPNSAVSVGGFQLTKKAIIFIVGGLLALVLAVVLLFATQKPAGPGFLNEASLYTSFIDTADITKNSGKYLQSSQLRATNGTLKSFLLDSAKQMETPLSKSGIDYKKLRSSAKKEPHHDGDMATKLENARLNDVYDRTYANEVGYKLEKMMAAVQKIKKTNTRKSMQEYLTEIEPDLKIIIESIDRYQQADSGAA